MKFGDQVIFTENGIEYPATVLAARILDEHAGAENEPLVHLAFFKEVKDGAGNTANILGTSRQFELIQFRADVAHETHEYDAEAKKESLKPGNVPLPQGVYPGGRWREVLPEISYGVPPIVFETKDGATTTEVPALDPGEEYNLTSSTGAVTEIPNTADAVAGGEPVKDETGAPEPPPTIN